MVRWCANCLFSMVSCWAWRIDSIDSNFSDSKIFPWTDCKLRFQNNMNCCTSYCPTIFPAWTETLLGQLFCHSSMKHPLTIAQTSVESNEKPMDFTQDRYRQVTYSDHALILSEHPTSQRPREIYSGNKLSQKATGMGTKMARWYPLNRP